MAEKAVVKKRKKKFVPLIAPDLFSARVLGEVPVFETPSVMGREITANFMTLTGDMKKQHINIGFRVTDIKDGKAMTDVVSYTIIPSLLKRFVRKGREKIDDSFVVETSDKKYVRIKPMLITNSSTHQSVVTNLRVTARKLIQNVAHQYTYNQLVEEIVTYKLQKFIRDHLHKTYPLKICEIRDFHILPKAPIGFTFEKEEIARIVAKSRAAKKNKPEKEMKGKNGEDAEESEDAEGSSEDQQEEQAEPAEEPAAEKSEQ